MALGRTLLGLAAGAVMLATGAFAQAYPERQITMVVPFCGRRPDRHGGAPDRREDVGRSWPADHRRECRRRRRHARRGQGGHGRAGWLHDSAAPYRHGHQRHALPQAGLRPAERLRICRPRHRSADDHRGAQGFRAGRLQGLHRLCEGQCATRSPWPMPASARPRICAACCS